MHNQPNLVTWCIGSFLCSTVIPWSGFALIPFYIYFERKRRIEKRKRLAEEYKLIFGLQKSGFFQKTNKDTL